MGRQKIRWGDREIRRWGDEVITISNFRFQISNWKKLIKELRLCELRIGRNYFKDKMP